jgi:hypothetical protein
MNKQNEIHTVFQFSPGHHSVSKSAVISPATPSTDYSTITEDSTPEPKARIYFDGKAYIPFQLFIDKIDNDKELETLRIQVSTLLQNNVALKEAVRSSEEKQMHTLDGAKKIIAEKDKTIGQLGEKLQKEKLEKKELKKLITKLQSALDETITKISLIKQDVQLKSKTARISNEKIQFELNDAVAKISDLKVMLQNEKFKKKKAKDSVVEKQIEFDDAMMRNCVATHLEIKIKSDEAKELLDKEKTRVSRCDNTIIELKLRLQKKNEKIQETNISHQYVPQLISNYSGSGSSSSLVSSGGGGEGGGGGGGGGQRCKDGSRDMRCKANQGFRKYGS